MSSPGVTFNLTCDKGVTELQKLTNLSLSSFAESHQMQQKNCDVSPYVNDIADVLCTHCFIINRVQSIRVPVVM